MLRAAIVTAALLVTVPATASSLIQGQVSVARNPNERAPLAAILSYHSAAVAAARIEIASPQRQWAVDFPATPAGTHALPIVGLRAATRHRIRLTLLGTDRQSQQSSRWIDYETPTLPSQAFAFPTLTTTRSDPRRMEPGFTLLSIRRSPIGRSPWRTDRQVNFARNWGCLVILDPEGQVVWYYIGNSRTAGVKQLANGNILIHRADSTMTEIDLLGNTLHQWYPENRPPNKIPGTSPQDLLATAVPIRGLQALHHQPFETPDGTFLSFGAHEKQIANYYTSETDPNAPRKEQLVVGDRVVEFDPSGKILWQWDAFEHLDPMRIGYELTSSYWQTRGFPGALDWTHGNGVSFDANRRIVLASFRHQDASIAIDRDTGDIRWILGEPTDWGVLQSKTLRSIGPLRWPYHSHNPRFTDAGTVIMFDNGTWGARPFRKPIDPVSHFSRAVEFEVDEQTMTVRQVWSTGDALTDDSCSAIAMGDAWRLPRTNNILVIYAMCLRNRPGMSWNDNSPLPSPEDQAPNASRIREYTRSDKPDIVFEVLARDPNDLVLC